MLTLAMLVLLAGCAAAPAAPAVQCRIVLESSPAFTAQTQTAAVTPGQSVTFTLTPTDGYMRITLNQLRNERLAKGQFSMRQMICC